MAITLRPLFLVSIPVSVALLLNCGDPQPPPPVATPDPPGAAVPLAPMTPVAAAIQLGAMPLAVDETGTPILLRGGSTVPRMRAVDATSAARMHVARLAPVWGATAATAPELESRGEVAMPGGRIVQLRQLIDGLPVDRAAGGEVRVMVGDDGALIAASGKLIPSDGPRDSLAPARFVDHDDASAVAHAVGDLYQATVSPAMLGVKSQAPDGTRMLAGDAGPITVSLSRAKQAWVADGNKLTAGWIVEAYSSGAATTDGDAYRTVIAADGRILERTNLKVDVAFNYRVFADSSGELRPFDGPIADITPHPVGNANTVLFPPYVTPNLVSVEGLNHPNGSATPDPWLAANRTETLGNNVEAYTDTSPPDGLTFGDFRATVTSLRTFDRTFNTSQSVTASQTQQMAGITQLFYSINWQHDFWYDAGFTEAAGNAQDRNFNRGGEDRDAMLAEAQDNANGGSRNNANMSTPADGFPPRMQVFVWDGSDDRSLAIAGRKPITGRCVFGNKSFELTAPVVLADDGNATGGSTTTDACSPLVAPATGRVVLVDRNARCTFKAAALNVQNAGGVAMIVANNIASLFPPALGDDLTITTPITIGAMSVLLSEGDAIKADLLAGPVTAQMHRNVAGDLEGTLDTTVVAHEFAHYMHHRLTPCNTRQCGAQSEGWGDFNALITMVRAGDNLNGSFAVGTYSTQGFPADPVYFGIRRAPYSADLEINPLMFHHMSDGNPLPAGTPQHPFNANANPNSEVHNGGEVWTSMMWQGYSALLQQPGADFTATRRKMQQYVVGGLLMAPTDATMTETRDSILLFAHASNQADHDVLAAAFAQRGFGSCAVSPPRGSTNFIGIVDSFEVKGRLAPGAPTLQSVARCDSDDVLDAGESARITVIVSNPGPAALAGVAVTLASSTPGIHIAQPTVPVGALAAYGATTARFTVTLDDTVTGIVAGDFTVTTTTSNGCNASVDAPLAIRLNTDDAPASSATDAFDAGGSVWAQAGSPAIWAHNRKSALDGFWFGADSTGPSDASLISPALIAGAGPLTISFVHRFSFEANANNAFDGGVIEYSTDNGATWQDISAIANPGYNATLSGTPATTENPLAGRPAYGRTSAGFPNTTPVTLDLGTSLAGQTFRLRFRVGSDTNTGGPGWDIDNVAFSGLVGTPFPTLIADPGHCNAVAPPPAGDGTGNSTDEPSVDPGDHRAIDDAGCSVGGTGTGIAAMLGLLVVLRRRRRR
jgi:MYXO-CTERM domain-containing protein